MKPESRIVEDGSVLVEEKITGVEMLLLFLLSFFLRGTILWLRVELGEPLYQYDASLYFERGVGVLHGTFPAEEPFYFHPLLPFVAAWMLAIFGEASHYAPLYVMLCLGAILPCAVASIASKLHGRAVGVIAGILVALHAGLIKQSTLFFDVSISAFVPLILYWCMRKPSAKSVFLGAAIGAIGVLGRGTLLLLDAIVILYFMSRSRTRKWGVLFFGIVLALLLPVVLRNAQYGSLCVTTNGPINLYIGNSKIATGRYLDPDQSFESQGETLFATLSDIAEEPSRWGGLMLEKVLLFFVIQPDRSATTEYMRWLPDNRTLFFFFFLSVLTLKSIRGAPLLCAITGTYFLSVVLFFVEYRFVLVLVPILSIFSAHGILELFKACRQLGR